MAKTQTPTTLGEPADAAPSTTPQVTVTEELPQAGGSYVRDPVTGALTRQTQTPSALPSTGTDQE